jgi:hypothetical protein
LKSIAKDAFRDYKEDAWFDEAVTYRRENVGTSDERIVYLWKDGFKDSKTDPKEAVAAL